MFNRKQFAHLSRKGIKYWFCQASLFLLKKAHQTSKKCTSLSIPSANTKYVSSCVNMTQVIHVSSVRSPLSGSESKHPFSRLSLWISLLSPSRVWASCRSWERISSCMLNREEQMSHSFTLKYKTISVNMHISTSCWQLQRDKQYLMFKTYQLWSQPCYGSINFGPSKFFVDLESLSDGINRAGGGSWFRCGSEGMKQSVLDVLQNHNGHGVLILSVGIHDIQKRK